MRVRSTGPVRSVGRPEPLRNTVGWTGMRTLEAASRFANFGGYAPHCRTSVAGDAGRNGCGARRSETVPSTCREVPCTRRHVPGDLHSSHDRATRPLSPFIGAFHRPSVRSGGGARHVPGGAWHVPGGAGRCSPRAWHPFLSGRAIHARFPPKPRIPTNPPPRPPPTGESPPARGSTRGLRTPDGTKRTGMGSPVKEPLDRIHSR
jgi:hypothetical protein